MIKVKPLEAIYKEDSDTFSKMDPYAIFKFNEKQFQTKAQQNSGKNPKWVEEFLLKVKDIKSPILKITTWDDDPVKDDFIGGAQINVHKWFDNPHQTQMENVDLEVKGQVVATMTIQYYYDPDLAPPEENAKFIL